MKNVNKVCEYVSLLLKNDCIDVSNDWELVDDVCALFEELYGYKVNVIEGYDREEYICIIEVSKCVRCTAGLSLSDDDLCQCCVDEGFKEFIV